MRNVVLVCLDSVRKDLFDRCAPTLRRRADIEYAQCRTTTSRRVPSYASMLTGTLPSQHGVYTQNHSYDGVDPSETFLADLPSHRTVGVSTTEFAGSSSGFDRFFDSFTDSTATRRFPPGLDPAAFAAAGGGLRASRSFLRAALAHEHPLQRLGNGVTGLLTRFSQIRVRPTLFGDGTASAIRVAKSEASVEEPFFLFTSFTEASAPVRPTQGFDRRVDSFVEWVTTNTEFPTTIVITATHGENLGSPEDDGLVGHSSSLSEGIAHVPLLVINAPGGLNGCERRFVSHLDLGELLVGLASGELPDVTREWVPAEVIKMGAGPEPSSESEHPDRTIRAVYDGRTPSEKATKVVWNSFGSVERYDIEPKRPCWQELVEISDDVPNWATDQFEVSIEDARRRTLSAEHSEASSVTQAQLKKPG